MFYSINISNEYSQLGFWGFGGQIYGDNDGAVTVSSAHHPLGAHIFTDPNLDHDQMPIGHNTWSRVLPYVNHLWRTSMAPEGTPLAASADPYAILPAGDILRGGPLTGPAIERFAVEQGAASVPAAVTSGYFVGATSVISKAFPPLHP